ncbi:hypothetical protein [Nitratifractor sp.]
MADFFAAYAHPIVFLHVISAVIWIGGMIAVRVAVHPVMQSIEDPRVRLGKSLRITKRLFGLVALFVAALLVTGLVMALATDGHHGPHKGLFIAKEAIWTVIALNYGLMIVLRNRSQRLFDAGEIQRAGKLAGTIPTRLLPINILLGMVAIWLGVSLRGF